MNIRETLEALVSFLRNGHQSGNTTAALHGVAHVGSAPGREWADPCLVYLTEQDARRSQQAFKVPCMSLSDPHRVRMARPGPVVFDTWTVEQLAEKALQRIQFLEGRLKELESKMVEVPDFDVNALADYAGLEGVFYESDIRSFFLGARVCHTWIRSKAASKESKEGAQA